MNANNSLSPAEYDAFLRGDFLSFLVRSFYEINPQGIFIPGKYIDLLASILQRFRDGRRKRFILNLPPRTLKSHAASVACLVARSRSIEANHLCQLRTRPGGQAGQRLSNINDQRFLSTHLSECSDLSS
jgi:hypothetical protein